MPTSVPHSVPGGWRFDPSYANLPECFFAPVRPTPVLAPRLLLFNEKLAADLGLDVATLKRDGAAILGGNQLIPGSTPIAQAYAGHQYGHPTMLGDGRALLLGEHLTPSGQRLDIQLKGSGPTPFSRRGDGRAALGPMLREYVVSEAMAALGVPTTRSLAVVTTGELVERETLLPGAILTRVAASHLRVGTFEYAARQSLADLKALSDYGIARHYPELIGTDHPYRKFLRAVTQRQAALIARWQSIGFIHGVMNTDNMAISGETIDYGPCAFLDEYSPDAVFSSIDRHGRYAYRNQPQVAAWNLARFAEALLPLLADDQPQAIAAAAAELQEFAATFRSSWLRVMRAKLGLLTQEAEDEPLIDDWLDLLRQNQLDWTNSFRALCHAPDVAGPLSRAPGFSPWRSRWEARIKHQPAHLDEIKAAMMAENPAYIPRNHRLDAAFTAATTAGDLRPVMRLLEALSTPFIERDGFSDLAQPPLAHERITATFCGT